MKITTQNIIRISGIFLICFICTEISAVPVDATASAKQKQGVIVYMRDPFWPVGFYPMPESKKENEEEREKEKQLSELQARTKWPKLELIGLTKTSDNKYVAILKDFGVVEPGDIISAKQDGLIYRWRINAITDKGILRTRLEVREPTPTLQNQ